MTTLAERLGLGRREVRGAFRGSRQRADPGQRVVVVGGGMAGVTAACVLAERGVAVTLVEAAPRLGGRMSSWTERFADGERFEMSRSLPAIFPNYYNVRAVLRRVDPELETLRHLDEHRVLGKDGASEAFSRLPSTPPLNLLALLRRSPLLSLADLRALGGEAGRAVLAFDPVRSYADLDTTSAAELMDQLGLPLDVRQVFSRAFARALFVPDEQLSAAEMVSRLHFYFLGNPDGMLFDVLDEPPNDVVWRPMERYLGRLGVDVRLSTSLRSIALDRSPPVAAVLEGGAVLEADGIVLAVDIAALADVVRRSPDLGADPSWRDSVLDLRVAPPFCVQRIFVDRPVSAEADAYVATTGLGSLDSVAIYERLEGESRRWARRTGGSVVQLAAYAIDAARTDEHVADELWERLRALRPELTDAKILHSVFLRRSDQPAFAPGSHARRPRVATPYGTVALAGDFVKLPFPTALMERAAASGILAANQLLDRWDVRGETVWSIPPRGFMASLRFGRGGP